MKKQHQFQSVLLCRPAAHRHLLFNMTIGKELLVSRYLPSGFAICFYLN